MKILIGCPTYEKYEFCVDLWVEAVKKIIEFSKEHQVDYLLVDNSEGAGFFERLKEKGFNIARADYSENVKDRIITSRNVLREKVLQEKYDYFFSLEQDVIPEQDILLKLLSCNKKIVSAYYSKEQGFVIKDIETGEIKTVKLDLPIVWLREEKGIRRAFPQEVKNKGLINVEAFGIGCVLIASEVLEQIKFRYEKDMKAYDDMYLCLDAKNLGYDIILDSDIRAKHLCQEWGLNKENL